VPAEINGIKSLNLHIKSLKRNNMNACAGASCFLNAKNDSFIFHSCNKTPWFLHEFRQNPHIPARIRNPGLYISEKEAARWHSLSEYSYHALLTDMA